MHISTDLIETLARMPRLQFCLLAGSNRKAGTILMKFIEPAHAGTIDSNSSEWALDNVRAYYLKSLSVFFGYAFVYDNKIVDLSPEFITITRPSSVTIARQSGVRLRHHDQHINIYESQDGCSVIALHNLVEVITANMVRRKKARDN